MIVQSISERDIESKSRPINLDTLNGVSQETFISIHYRSSSLCNVFNVGYKGNNIITLVKNNDK